jgi:FkbM family methyltransferase
MLTERLARVFYPHGARRVVLRGPARGRQFVVAPGIGLSYALGRAEVAPAFFTRYVRPGMCVFDVGANKGQMTLIFASLVGPAGRVVAIEPAPAEFASLSQNVGLNGLSHVHAMHAAAADVEGTLAFTYSPARPTQGKLADVERTYVIPNADTIAVRAITLDSLLSNEPPPALIKIDCEGAAAAVLRGGRRLLAASRPTIYLELHGPDEQAGVRDELLARGYAAETLDGQRVDDPTAGWHSPLVCRPDGARRT